MRWGCSPCKFRGLYCFFFLFWCWVSKLPSWLVVGFCFCCISVWACFVVGGFGMMMLIGDQN